MTPKQVTKNKRLIKKILNHFNCVLCGISSNVLILKDICNRCGILGSLGERLKQCLVRIFCRNRFGIFAQNALNRLAVQIKFFAIANAFFRCGEVEAWGRGIGKIVNGAIAEKLLPPLFDTSFGGLMVTFFNSPAEQLKEAGISERGILAIEFALKNGRITNTDVQEMAKVSKPTATRLLASLSDYLEVKGTTGKGTYYVVKGLIKGS